MFSRQSKVALEVMEFLGRQLGVLPFQLQFLLGIEIPQGGAGSMEPGRTN